MDAEKKAEEHRKEEQEAKKNSRIPSISAPGVKAQDGLLYEIRREVNKLLDLAEGEMEFHGAQPVSFKREHLQELKEKDYYLCEKSDGMRYLLYSTYTFPEPQGKDAEMKSKTKPKQVHYLIDRNNDYWFVDRGNLYFPFEKQPNSERKFLLYEGEEKPNFLIETIIDGELVLHGGPDPKDIEPRFLIFDCLVMDGFRLMEKTLDKRLGILRQQLYNPYQRNLQKHPNEMWYQPFRVELKDYQLAYGIPTLFNQILPSLKHGNDGLIFTCKETAYRFKTDKHILKWKPPHENSVDFRLRLEFPRVEPTEAERLEGITQPFIDFYSVPRAELLQYKGKQGHVFYDELYLPQDEWETLMSLRDPLNDRVVECYQDEHKRWRLKRFRDDKINGNFHTTVTSVVDSIKNPVTKEHLMDAWTGIRDNWKARQAYRERYAR